MDHESQDLDGVIDEVAQAMTSVELARDLRPAIAGRVTSRQSWTLGWRVAIAAAALAVVVVAVMVQPGESPGPTHVADSRSPGPVVAPEPTPATVDASASAPAVIQARAADHAARRAVGRQTLAPATPGIVEIDPLAVVPLKGDDVGTSAQALSRVMVIAPIDVEPVRISELELVE
jgi:hypothetical protein